MRHQRPQQAIFAALLLVLLGAAWIAFAPLQFGGQASYVIINGISMEPGFHRGDLAILRQAPDYQIGDIVTYYHPQIGPVIHRIIALDGDRYVFKGDNNAWIDGYRPTQAECIGKLWWQIPGAGSLVDQLRVPRNMALLGAVLGFMVMATVIGGPDRHQWRSAGRKPLLTIRFVLGGRAERRPAHRDIRRAAVPAPGAIGAVGESMDILFFALAALAFASLLMAIFAFTRPTTRSIPDDLPYEQTGVFSYSAAAPAGIYDFTSVQTGDPIFRQLTSAVTVNFAYRLAADQLAAVHGTYRLIAEISDISGWKRIIELQPKTAFGTGAFTASGRVDLARVQALIDSFEKQTGLQRQQYTLAVVPQATLQGTLSGQELQDEFAPRLEFQLDRLQMQLVKDSSRAPDPLKPAQPGLLKHSAMQPNTLALLGLTLEVARARWIALAGLALAVGGLLMLRLFMRRAAQGDEPARIRLKYGPLLIAIHESDSSTGLGPAQITGGPLVAVATIDDLAKLAEQSGRVILYTAHGTSHRYLVYDGDVTYCYQIADSNAASLISTENGAI